MKERTRKRDENQIKIDEGKERGNEGKEKYGMKGRRNTE